MSPEDDDALARVLFEGIARGDTPGAVCHVEQQGGATRTLALGKRGLPPVDTPVDENTIYDLASLTKLLATTWLTATAVARGVLSLDEEPFGHWPGVCVADVLAHRAGLPAWRPLYEDVAAHRVLGLDEGRALLVARARAVEPEHPPRTRTLYSDIGFIALGALVEERLGARLDEAFAPLAARHGVDDVAFCPIFERGYLAPLGRVAPTERCALRGRVVHGQVHDENAYAMGGVAGHAGLFGTVRGTAALARAMLAAIVSPRDDEEAMLARFAREDGERPLGFDRATKDGSTGGALSELAVGHLGFTGTSLWLDPAHEGGPAFFVLLTNRVHPTRENAGIRMLRPAFHRAAAQCLAEARARRESAADG